MFTYNFTYFWINNWSFKYTIIQKEIYISEITLLVFHFEIIGKDNNDEHSAYITLINNNIINSF